MDANRYVYTLILDHKVEQRRGSHGDFPLECPFGLDNLYIGLVMKDGKQVF